MSENTKFIYCDARGVISFRDIENVSKSEEYIQGYCANDKGFRTFRKDRVLEYVYESSNVDERLKYHIANHSPPREETPKRSYTKRLNTSNAREICFTGFKKEDKTRLAERAKSEGMFVRDSVTKQLVYLCCGYNAGPKKIEKSRHQGVIILSESQFLEMLETGVIPEE